MNVFEAVKQNVSTREAAEQYGLTVSRSGMTGCPFHPDKHPSMKVDQRFHCLGCQADGDVIDFVSQLLGFSSVDAAIKLAQDFSIPYGYRGRERARTRGRDVPRQKHPWEEKLRLKTLLLKYLSLLRFWEQEYEPKSPEEKRHPLFAEALERKNYIEYLLEELASCSDDRFEEWKHRCQTEVRRIEKRISEAITQ